MPSRPTATGCGELALLAQSRTSHPARQRTHPLRTTPRTSPIRMPGSPHAAPIRRSAMQTPVRRCWPRGSSAPPRSARPGCRAGCTGRRRAAPAGMLLQVRSDRTGVMDAVVIADHHEHRSQRERLVEHAQQGDEVRCAAPAQPVHPRPGGHLERPEHGDLPVLARGENLRRMPRSVQLARTCGSRFRWVSGPPRPAAPTGAAAPAAGPRSRPPRGHEPDRRGRSASAAARSPPAGPAGTACAC
jgi:hypothetical protein